MSWIIFTDSIEHFRPNYICYFFSNYLICFFVFTIEPVLMVVYHAYNICMINNDQFTVFKIVNHE